MLLETILCKFERICAAGYTLMVLETSLLKFGLTGNAHMLLETILCKFGRICTRASALRLLQTVLRQGNSLMLLKTSDFG